MADGDILSILDSQGFAVVVSEPSVLCVRNKNVVVLLSAKHDSNIPFVRSIQINDAGAINATPLDSLALWDDAGRDLGLIHWYEDIFIAIQNNASADCRLISFSVSDAGVIPAAITDDLTLLYASNRSHKSDLLQIHDTVIVTGSCGPSDSRHVETALVPQSGSFAAGLADSMETSATLVEQRFRQGSGTMIVGAWIADNITSIFTFECNAAGTVPATPLDAWVAHTAGMNYVNICKITDLEYAIFTIDSDNKARIRTFHIQANGTIVQGWDDEEEVETAGLGACYMVELFANHFIIHYQVSGIPGRIRTYYIADDGTITAGGISFQDLVYAGSTEAAIVHLQGNIYAMSFYNTATQVMLLTLEIETPPLARSHHEMIMKVGP